MRYLLAALLFACGPVEQLPEFIATPPGSYELVTELMSRLGPPCSVQLRSNGLEEWAFCLESCESPPRWCPSTCEGACPAKQYFAVAGIYVLGAEVPPSP